MVRTEDLRNVPLADIVGRLCQSGRPGTLTVTTPRRKQRVTFDGQNIALLDTPSAHRRRLGEILVAAQKVTKRDIDAALLQQQKDPCYLGQILLEQNKIDAEILGRVLQLQLEEELYELFSGQFCLEFEPGDPATEKKEEAVAVPFSAPVLELAGRVDEWNTIRSSMPDFTDVFSCQVDPAAWHDDDEAQILRKLDGKASVQLVADSLLESPRVVAKTLHRLEQDGFASKCSNRELLASAETAVSGGDYSRGLLLLEKIAPSEVTAEEGALLAELLCAAGNIRQAARVQVGMAKRARTQQQFEKADTHLRAALDACPNAVEVIKEQCELARARGDRASELELLHRLLQRSLDGEPRGALPVLKRLLKLDPANDRVRMIAVDLYEREDLIEDAVQALEVGIKLAKKNDAGETLVKYANKLLQLAPARSDVQRLVEGVQEKSFNRTLVRIASLVAVAAGLAFGLWWFHGLEDSDETLSQVESASVLVNQGRFDQARELLQSADVAGAPEEIAAVAENVVQKLETQAAATDRLEQKSAQKLLDEKFAEVELLVEKRQFGPALTMLIDATLPSAAAESESRGYARIRALCEEYGQVARQTLGELDLATRPKTPLEINQRLQQLDSIRSAFAEQDLREFHRGVAGLVETAPERHRAALRDVEMMAASHLDTLREIDRYAVDLEERVRDNEALNVVLKQLQQAEQAAAAGAIDRALKQYRSIDRTFLDEVTREKLSKTVQTLEHVSRILSRIDQQVEAHEFEAAHETALALQESFPELAIRLPVRLTTIPEGARLSLNGKAIKTSPASVHLLAGEEVELHVSMEGYAAKTRLLRGSDQAIWEIDLVKNMLYEARLPGKFAAQPAVIGNEVFAAARDGSLYRLSPKQEPEQIFRTESLGGTIARPLPTGQGLLLTTIEGTVFHLKLDQSQTAELWRTNLNRELRIDPVPYQGSVLLTCEDGAIVSLSLATGAQQWILHHPKLRCTGMPLAFDQRLYVPTNDGNISVYDLEKQQLLAKWSFGSNLGTSLERAGNLLVAATVEGKLLKIQPESGQHKVIFDAQNLPSGDLMVEGSQVHFNVGNRIFCFDLATDKLSAHWTGNVTVTGKPCRVGQKLIAAGSNGHVYGFTDGKQQPQFRSLVTDASAVGGPVPLTDRAAVLLFKDGTLCVVD